MFSKSKLYNTVPYLSLLVFFVFTIYILYINAEVLYTAHDHSAFLYGMPFFESLMSKPFGLMQYVGAWLTQLFYYPALGAGVLLGIWALIFIVGKKALCLKGSASSAMLLPVACLLTSLVDLGYWVYVMPFKGYWFSQSVAYLLMLMLLWAARRTPRRWHFICYLLGVCIYPVLGWFALLFIACLIVSEKPHWRDLTGVVAIAFAASIWHTLLYSQYQLSQVELAGLPRFVSVNDVTEHLTNPFWALAAITLLMLLISRRLDKWFVPVLSCIVGIVFTLSLKFSDDNYINEMRMVRYAENDKWKEVITVAEGADSPTASMLMLRNIALMNEGGLLDSAFKKGNISHPMYNPDSVHVSFLQVAAPLANYNYGLLNESIRLSYECAVQTGFSPFYLKMLSRATLATGEDKLRNRFTSILHHNLFYKDWQPAKVTAKVGELQKAYPDEITGVENSENFIVNSICLWNDTISKTASDQRLFYSMVRCDAECFWPALRNFIRTHQNDPFPVHVQEAYIYFIDKYPEERRMMVPVEESVYNRYKEFWDEVHAKYKPGMKLRDLKAPLAKWNDTYWYYCFFRGKVY